MTIRVFLVISSMLTVCLSSDILVGTGSNKIYHLTTNQGVLGIKETFATGAAPSWILLSNSKKYLFAVNEDSQGIQSFGISKNGENIQLHEINKVDSTGDSPCFLSITSDDQYLGVANYGTNYALFGIDSQGHLSNKPVQYFAPKDGHGPRPDRQEKSHPHQFFITPDNTKAYISDLGTDRIYFHQLHDGQMAKEVTTTVKPGSGPRHIVASPFDAHTLYGTNELNGEINRYKIQNDGTLTLEQSFSANPTQQFSKSDSNAAIVISKAGFLFASIRGQNKVSVFKINDKQDLLFLNVYDVHGKTPRFITLNPEEDKLYVLHQDSASLAVFNVNHDQLKLIQLLNGVESPQSLIFY